MLSKIRHRTKLSQGSVCFRIAAIATGVVLLNCAEELAERPCPTNGTTLTYENFGKEFIDSQCQNCHAGDADHGDSHGIPAGYSFATVADVRRHRERIFVRAAGKNDSMPPGPDDPPLADREKLAEWLACGAP